MIYILANLITNVIKYFSLPHRFCSCALYYFISFCCVSVAGPVVGQIPRILHNPVYGKSREMEKPYPPCDSKTSLPRCDATYCLLARWVYTNN